MNYKVTLLIVGSLALCATTAVSAQNLLTNGNVDVTMRVNTSVPPAEFFQARPVGWVYEGSRTLSGLFNDGLTSEAFPAGAPTPMTTDATGLPIPDGCGDGELDCGVFFKPFNGGNPAAGDLLTVHLYQDNPATPGLKYILSGWAGAASNYSGLIPDSVTQSQLALEFDNDNDRGNGVLQTDVLDLRSAGLGQNASGGQFGYDEYMVMAVAPAGATVVRSRISMIDGYSNPAGGPHAFVADDFSLIAIPEPTTVAMLALGLVGLLGVRPWKR